MSKKKLPIIVHVKTEFLEFHKEQFKLWVDVHKITLITDIKEITPSFDFKIGDTVNFTNDAGIIFEGYEVLGFTQPFYKNGGCIFVNSDCYWFPKKPQQLTKVD